jgi:hypothetical protein
MCVLESQNAIQSASVSPPPPGRESVVAVPPLLAVVVSTGGLGGAIAGTLTGEGALSVGGLGRARGLCGAGAAINAAAPAAFADDPDPEGPAVADPEAPAEGEPE